MSPRGDSDGPSDAASGPRPETPSAAPRPNVVRAVLGAVALTAAEAALLAFGTGSWSALGEHPRALALLAAWFAGGLTLSLLRPVRRHQPVALEPESPVLLAALFFIPFLTPGFAALGERFGWAPLPGGAALRWTGVAISAAGLALRIAAIARMGSRFSPFLAVQERHVLETRGPYARVRHPGYLGAWLATAGAALAFGSAVALVPAAAFLALLDRRARREEKLLERHFGDAYRHYRARTGRLFPRLGGGG